MTYVHGCVHQTNLSAQEASKNIEIKETCKMLDVLLNQVVCSFPRISRHGGEDAFINIKYMVPTYESCVTH